MRRFLMLALAATLGLVTVGGLAYARPSSSTALQLWFGGGEPASLGVLTSTGANVTNASTAAPFTISTTTVPTRTVLVQCDATTYVGFATAVQADGGVAAPCGTSLATSSGCVRLGTSSPRADGIFVLQDSTTAINAAGGGAFNCIVSKLQ